MPALDYGSLHCLLTGTLDVDEEQRAWAELVSHSGAPVRWQRAVQQRTRLDSLAKAISGRPWLAQQLLMLAKVGRRLKHLPRHPLELWPSAALLEATLAPSSQDGEFMIELEWGRALTYQVPVGSAVEIRPRDASADLQVFGVSGGKEVAVTSRSWQLELGEAPVLLVAGIHGEKLATLRELITHSAASAAVVLVEALPDPLVTE